MAPGLTSESPGGSSSKETTIRHMDPSMNGGLMLKFFINGVEFGHHGTVNDACFSWSELRIATAGGDRLIKFWDPRDGTYIRCLKSHEHEVTSLRYTTDDLYLVSAGADMTINIWDLSVNSVIQRLYGHSDVIYSISISPDCSFIVSSSHDSTLKTWYLTPQVPAKIDSIQCLSKTDRSILISWTAPTSFGEEVTAYFIQYRAGNRGEWKPNPPTNVPPVFRNKLIGSLVPATEYQFRMRAENRMGLAEWSDPSKIIETEYGEPDQVERPQIADVTRRSVVLYWFTPNPYIYKSSPSKFKIEYSGEGKDWSDFAGTYCGKNTFAHLIRVLLSFLCFDPIVYTTVDRFINKFFS